MREDLKKLLHLQSLDFRTRQLEEEQEAQARDLEELAGKIEAEEKMAEAGKVRLQQEQVKIKDLELEVDDKKNQIEKYQNQLLRIKTNKEYQALLHEIEGLRADIRVVEDKMLDLMEEAETGKRKLGELQVDLEGLRKKHREEEAAARRDFERTSREMEEIKSNRERVAASLEEELLEKYERIFKHKPDRALVPVVGKACQGCNMEVTTQVLNDLQKGDAIDYCENCGRLIYLPE